MKKPRPSVDSSQTGHALAKGRVEAGSAGRDGINQKSVEQASAPADQTQPTHAELLARVGKMLLNATGVRNDKLANLIVTQVSAMQVWGSAENKVERQVNAMGMIQEMDPKNVTEAMLAVQMFGVHNAAVKFLRQAIMEGQTFQGTEANVLRATRLMRLFNEQLEAMAKLKGKAGQQKVTVEHVHVHSGGQAIVGSMETSTGSEAEPKTCVSTPGNPAGLISER